MRPEPLARVPEPELMDTPEQVDAYARADFAQSNQAFVDRLADALNNGHEDGRIIDLGCGPADICIRIARALPPTWHIIGLDAGPNMLSRARQAIARAGLVERIGLIHARLPAHGLPRASHEAVVSNSLLHHLPDPDALWRTVRELAAPGAWVQVMDLARPDRESELERLVEIHAAGEPEVLRADFGNSLRAAWRVEEVTEQLARAGLALPCEAVSDRHWMVRGRLPGP